ncbi:MFS transporter [Paenibacillus pasadenensis]|uniref:MFS transporter n=1 Tax=Paenibacillus pasadenensis TaxID=217090 RepID=UPI0020411C16|nr:MFS transporter [Paenibacillus pasadenensis]MCM3749469.1 MFS transporter [Paenibacillus pasadenensis]
MRKLILLGCLSYFVIGLAHVVAGAVLEPIMANYELDYAAAGQWITNQFLGFLVGVLAAPAISSRIGRRTTLIIALGALTAAEAVYSILPPWEIILIAAPVAGFGFGMTEAVVGALVMDVFAKGKASVMGWLEVAFGVGALAMPGVAALLIRDGIWSMSFPVLTALAGVSMLLWMTLSFGKADEAVAYTPRLAFKPGTDEEARFAEGKEAKAFKLLEADGSAAGQGSDESGMVAAPGLDGPVAVPVSGKDTAGAAAVRVSPDLEANALAASDGLAGGAVADAVRRNDAAAGQVETGGKTLAAGAAGSFERAESVGSQAAAADDAAEETNAAGPGWLGYRKGAWPLLSVGMLFFFLYVGLEMVFANYLPSIMTNGSGLPEAEASAVLSLFWGTMVAGRLIIGIVTRRTGYRIYLLASVGVSLVMLVLLAGAQTLSWTLVFVALSGFGMAGIFAIALIYVNERLPGMTDRTTSLLVACGGLGGAIFPKLGGWLFDLYGWQRLLQLTAVMAFVLLVLVLVLLAMRDRLKPTA